MEVRERAERGGRGEEGKRERTRRLRRERELCSRCICSNGTTGHPLFTQQYLTGFNTNDQLSIQPPFKQDRGSHSSYLYPTLFEEVVSFLLLLQTFLGVNVCQSLCLLPLLIHLLGQGEGGEEREGERRGGREGEGGGEREGERRRGRERRREKEGKRGKEREGERRKEKQGEEGEGERRRGRREKEREGGRRREKEREGGRKREKEG